MSDAKKPPITRVQMQVAATKSDFERCFDKAMRDAGGGALFAQMQHRTLAELRDTLAPNGVRFHYHKYSHMDEVQIHDILLDAANALR